MLDDVFKGTGHLMVSSGCLTVWQLTSTGPDGVEHIHFTEDLLQDDKQLVP